MKFQKGQSGNPGGRPKVLETVRDLARQHGPAAFERVVSLMASDDERVAFAAAQEILNRAYGKPTQTVDMTATVETRTVARMPPVAATSDEWQKQYASPTVN